MSKVDYLICAIFSFLFGVYFIAIKELVAGFIHIALSLLNIKWFIREIRSVKNEIS